MRKTKHHNDENGDDKFNYIHDSCPTCQDRLIMELGVERCESHIFYECCDFSCPECQCWWDDVEELVEKLLEGESILSRLKDEDITASRARKSSVQVFNQSFLQAIGKRCLDGTSWLFFAGVTIPIEKQGAKRIALASMMMMFQLIISHSDSDILETVERPILSNFWTMIAQR